MRWRKRTMINMIFRVMRKFREINNTNLAMFAATEIKR